MCTQNICYNATMSKKYCIPTQITLFFVTNRCYNGATAATNPAARMGKRVLKKVA